MTPTQRTMRELRSQGIKCQVVERWNHYAKVRQDLFGIIDVVACDKARGVIGVQCCSNLSSHWNKLTIDKAQDSLDWLETPGTFLEIWHWRKVKKVRGGKALVWKPKVLEITENVIGVSYAEYQQMVKDAKRSFNGVAVRRV